MAGKRIAVIGAGPVGIETALQAARLGHDVQVYERGRVGDNVRSWGHVTLFSPWSRNVSALGREQLLASGTSLPDDDTCPTGAQYLDAYLLPLSEVPLLRGRVHERHQVVQVGRQRLGKLAPLGAERRGQPFRLLLDGVRGEAALTADLVFDTSGTYGNHNWMGSGNIPAVGERRLQDRIAYTLEDIRGAARFRYAGRRVLLVGSGFSAATALEALSDLPGTSTVWVARSAARAPYAPIDDDPLPQRRRLALLGNSIASGSHPAVTFRAGTDVERIDVQGFGLTASLRCGEQRETVDVDRILALVGYRPDSGIYRELQVHECYATSGPMGLASALSGAAHNDCLSQTSQGPESLLNPEPDFFILGSKSYGRLSQFLIQLGLAQIREAFSLVETPLPHNRQTP